MAWERVPLDYQFQRQSAEVPQLRPSYQQWYCLFQTILLVRTKVIVSQADNSSLKTYTVTKINSEAFELRYLCMLQAFSYLQR